MSEVAEYQCANAMAAAACNTMRVEHRQQNVTPALERGELKSLYIFRSVSDRCLARIVSATLKLSAMRRSPVCTFYRRGTAVHGWWLETGHLRLHVVDVDSPPGPEFD